jgi:hypothetical protein
MSTRQISYGCNLDFLGRSRYFFFLVDPQLYSRDWMDPVPDIALLRKSSTARNGTRIWICSQELYVIWTICWQWYEGAQIDVKHSFAYNYHNFGHYLSSHPLLETQLSSVCLSILHRKHITFPSEPNRLMLSIGLWWWYITTTILDIIHRPVLCLKIRPFGDIVTYL